MAYLGAEVKMEGKERYKWREGNALVVAVTTYMRNKLLSHFQLAHIRTLLSFSQLLEQLPLIDIGKERPRNEKARDLRNRKLLETILIWLSCRLNFATIFISFLHILFINIGEEMPEKLQDMPP